MHFWDLTGELTAKGSLAARLDMERLQTLWTELAGDARRGRIERGIAARAGVGLRLGQRLRGCFRRRSGLCCRSKRRLCDRFNFSQFINKICGSSLALPH